MFLAVDFDGTIVDHSYPLIGQPVPGALDALKEWGELGHQIILLTMRHDDLLMEAVDYLESNGIELYGVNDNASQQYWTGSRKVYAHYYIDDAAVGCPLIRIDGFSRPCVDWQSVLKLVDARRDSTG